MIFVCKSCRYEREGWERDCSFCGSTAIVSKREYERWVKASVGPKAQKTVVIGREGSLDSFPDENVDRIKIGWPQMDYLFGGSDGGIQRAKVYRLTGEPGIGKSTLLLDIAARTKALYLGAEETGASLSTRARRMAIKNMRDVQLCMSASMERAMAAIRRYPRDVIIVDSLQAFRYITAAEEDNLDAPAFTLKKGHDDNVSIAMDFIKLARKMNVAIILVSHVNKDGDAEGFKSIEHMIDATMVFSGDRKKYPRTLAFEKSRCSAVAGIEASFWMTTRGLVDAPTGDPTEALERMIAEGLIEAPLNMLAKEAAEPPRTFDQFDREADAPREKPTRRPRRGRAP